MTNKEINEINEAALAKLEVYQAVMQQEQRPITKMLEGLEERIRDLERHVHELQRSVYLLKQTN